MRIPEVYASLTTAVPRVERRRAGTTAEGGTNPARRSTDRLDFSARATEFAQARRAALEAPAVREGLVNELSGRIDRGQYQVSGADVGAALLRDQGQFLPRAETLG